MIRHGCDSRRERESTGKPNPTTGVRAPHVSDMDALSPDMTPCCLRFTVLRLAADDTDCQRKRYGRLMVTRVGIAAVYKQP